jgi:hypothetical protein
MSDFLRGLSFIAIIALALFLMYLLVKKTFFNKKRSTENTDLLNPDTEDQDSDKISNIPTTQIKDIEQKLDSINARLDTIILPGESRKIPQKEQRGQFLSIVERHEMRVYETFKIFRISDNKDMIRFDFDLKDINSNKTLDQINNLLDRFIKILDDHLLSETPGNKITTNPTTRRNSI